ncbi:putative RNA-directed DNA polymerase [Helianthus debilis subsp. tardiflorus]
METIRLLLAMAASGGWLVHHLDVKSAFLNGELSEEVYVSQPDGFVIKGKENNVYKLNKALYGLRQAPRAWNAKLDKKSDSLLIVGVYVDDIIVTGPKERDIGIFKSKMKSAFEMSDLGQLSYYLGIEVDQQKTGIILKQSAYAKKILKLAGMTECNSSKFPMHHKLKLTKEGEGKEVDPTLYRRLIGSLRYLIHTRPDISYSVGVVSRFMEKPKENHLLAVKHILRYIKGSVHYGLKYRSGGDGKLLGYSDSSFGTDLVDRRGTTGTVFYLSNNLITWSSQKQRTVALSSCEAEFMVATEAACQALWLRNLVSELTGKKAECVKILVDNEGSIALMKNPVFHGRSKHIDTKFHFIRECVDRDLIIVEHVSGDLQKADLLTKALPLIKFTEMKMLVGVEDFEKTSSHQGENVG